jgi:hypothetical protein
LLTGFVTLDIEALVESTHKSGEFYIFTCGCGVPDCAGVSHGVIVLHSRYYIEWLIPEPLQEPYFDMDSVAERDGHFYVILDESTMADMLDEGDAGGSDVVKVLEFDTDADREAYLASRFRRPSSG